MCEVEGGGTTTVGGGFTTVWALVVVGLVVGEVAVAEDTGRSEMLTRPIEDGGAVEAEAVGVVADVTACELSPRAVVVEPSPLVGRTNAR